MMQVLVTELTKGTSSVVSGHFSLSFKGHSTAKLAHDASAAAVEAALEQLPGLNDVQVTQYSYLNNGSMWVVRFLDPYGQVPLLAFQSNQTSLNGTDLVAAVHEDVEGNELGGTFILEGEHAAKATPPLSFNVTAAKLQQRLLDLFGVSSGIVVDRGTQTPTGGVTWTVTFPQSLGNVEQLQADSSGLTGDEAAVAVETVQDGTQVEVQVIRSYATSPLSGTFSLAFRGEESAPLPFDASAQQVEDALEAFHFIDDVIVTRSGPDVINTDRLGDPAYSFLGQYLKYSTNSYAWTVTFASHVGDMPPIGLCCDSKFGFNGRQTLFAQATGDATLEVEERVKGSGAKLGGTFTLAVDNNVTTATTKPIPYNATSQQLASALLELTDTGNVTVTRSAEDENAQYTWSVTFQDWQAVPFVSVRGATVDDSGLQGTKAYMTLLDGGDWNRKQIMQISAAVSHGNVSGCVLKPPSGGDVALNAFPFNGTAADLQQVFDALGPSVVGSVKVTVEEDLLSPTNGSVWTVVFPELAHNMGPIDCGSKAKVKIVHNGTYLSLNGTFRLSYQGVETASLPHDVTAAQMEYALSLLPGLQNVTVSGGALSGFNPTRSWNVTFTGIGADVDMLVANTTGLEGSNPVVRVDETRKGSALSGTFRMGQLGLWTSPIPYDASAGQMQARLLELPNLDSLNVTRTSFTRGMAAWTVTFLHRVNGSAMARNAGDLQPLTVDTTGLSGFQAGANVTTLHNGTRPIKGKFQVRYGSLMTRKIRYDAGPEDLRYFLRELPLPASALAIDRQGPDDNGGYNWTVRLPLRYRLNQTLSVDGTHLRGGLPQVEVNVSLGTLPISGNFTLAYRHDAAGSWLVTGPIDANASAATVASQLSSLPGLYNVSVTSERITPRPGAHDNGARRWHITFTSLAQAGDRPLLLLNDSSLHGSNVAASVVETTKGSSAKVMALTLANVTGTFRLAYTNHHNLSMANSTVASSWLHPNVSALALSREMSSLPGLGHVVVERQRIPATRVSSRYQGWVWYMLLADQLGDNATLALNTTRLNRTALRVSAHHVTTRLVTTANASVSPLSGQLSFVYGQRCEDWQGGYNCRTGVSQALHVGNVTADTVRHALQTLPAVVNVSVSMRTSPTVQGRASSVAHGFMLRITFHEVAINVSGTASSGAYPWTWTPDIASVRWSGQTVVGGASTITRMANRSKL